MRLSVGFDKEIYGLFRREGGEAGLGHNGVVNVVVRHFLKKRLACGAPSPHLLFQVEDRVQRDAGIPGNPLGGISVSQEIFRNFHFGFKAFKCHVNHIHSLHHEVPRTKITQFHLVLQYPEYGVVRKLAEIGPAIERVDSAEPLGKAAMVICEGLDMVVELLHLDNRDGLLVEIQLHVLVVELHRVAVLAGFFPGERVEELERKGFRAAIMDAMKVCADKSRAMSK